MRKLGSTLQTVSILLFLCLTLNVTLALHAQESQQQAGVSPLQVHTDLIKTCVGVKCKGSSSYATVPGYGETPELAYADAIVNANAHCGGEENVDDIRQTRVEIILCPYAELSLDGMIIKRTMAMGGTWRVKGKLFYCDGTDGFEFVTSGPTRCEAIKIAQTKLCEAKEPCKRAWVCVWVIEAPTATCPPTNCCPRR
ncbi:MAG: hypothetical protein SFV81_18870 [Pirellulaceae bacterium]|nr:hypothetical protein [Pirellulaceae bacterium]